jgi:hypothetical protein
MARSKTYRKNIACLESLWDHDIENHLSVLPILKLTAKRNRLKSIFLTCNTLHELEHNLRMIKKKKAYGILYLAFHGYPGGIFVDGTPVDIETVALLMGRGFRNWIIHFGCCETFKAEKDRIAFFLSETQTLMATGYKEWVDWTEGTALDFLLLDRLQFYKDMKKFWPRFRRAYRDLIHLTGLVAFHKKS